MKKALHYGIIGNYICLLLVFPFYNKFVIYVLILLFINSIINQYYNKEKISNSYNIYILLPIMYFVQGAVSLLYSSNLLYGFFVIEKRLLFIGYPLIFIICYKVIQQIREIGNIAFVIGCIVALAFCIGSSFYLVEIEYLSKDRNWWYFYKGLSSHIKINPGYFTYIINIALAILLFKKFTDNKIFLFSIIVFFIGGVILLSSFTATLGTIYLIILYFIYKGKVELHKIIFISLFLFIASIILLYFFEWHNLFFVDEHRFRIWNSIFHCIESPTLIGGVGIGDVKDFLIACYNNTNFKSGAEFKYNSHNLFLETLLESGLIGLFFVIILFIPLIKLNIRKSSDILFFYHLSSFFLYSISEETFGHFKGVSLFIIFYFHFMPTRFYKLFTKPNLFKLLGCPGREASFREVKNL